MNTNNSNYIVQETDSLEEAMKAITANHRGAAVVVDAEHHLVGITTDGIIRRAMLKGAIMQTPIHSAVERNVITITAGEKQKTDTEKILADHPEINVIPVIDAENKVMDVVVRGGEYT